MLNFTVGGTGNDFSDNETELFSNESVYLDFAEINIPVY